MSHKSGGDRIPAIPEQLPVLARGAHRHPAQGACLMEYTALLSGAAFNDHPDCTHPAMAELARQVNDRVTGKNRPVLITRAPALAALGPQRCGVAAAVAGAVITSNWQHAPEASLLSWRTRRAARIRESDTPGRGWWGRKRDLHSTYELITSGLDRLARSTNDREVRDQLLLEVLDSALSECQPATHVADTAATGGASTGR